MEQEGFIRKVLSQKPGPFAGQGLNQATSFWITVLPLFHVVARLIRLLVDFFEACEGAPFQVAEPLGPSVVKLLEVLRLSYCLL